MIEFPQLTIRFIEVNKGEHLTTVFERENFELNAVPANCILDKTLPGLGATYSEIIAQRHSIIIEPNVPVIVGKSKSHKGLLAVYEGCKEKEIENYLLNPKIKYKKILCTPEGYMKLKRVADDNDVNLYSDYFCLYDECEKITQDIDYREEISLPMNDFFLYERKAFVSATPLKLRNPNFQTQNFTILKVKPTFDFIKNLNLITTNNYENTIIRLLDNLKGSECICVFMNSTNGINKLINHLEQNGETDYKAFCSKKSEIKFKERAITQSYENLDLPLAKYNFFTSRFFSAVDIHSLKKPDIIIVTDLTEAKHSRIDPFTNTIQIYGRFRDTFEDGTKFNSLTHVTNYGAFKDLLNEDEIDNYIATSREIYEQLKDRAEQAENKGAKEALQDSLNGCSYSRFIDDSGEVNYFKIDNFFDDERVKGYYTTPESILTAYQETQHFTINHTNFLEFISDNDKFYYKKRKSKLERRKFLIQRLDDNYRSGRYTVAELTQAKADYLNIGDYKVQNETRYSIEAYEALGYEAIEQVNFQKTQIDRLLSKTQKETDKVKMFSQRVKKEIQAKFKENTVYDKTDLFAGFEEVFRKFGIISKINLLLIRKYFGADELKGKNDKGKVRLRLFEPDI